MYPLAIFVFNKAGITLTREVFSIHEYGQFEQHLISGGHEYQVYIKRLEETE